MQQAEKPNNLMTILDKAILGRALSCEEIGFLLSLDAEEDLERLFAAAGTVRSRWFGKTVFLYGFLYFNTACSNNCLFCQYRKSNSKATRYSKSTEMIDTIVRKMEASGVHLIDLTMGEFADGTKEAESEYGRLSSFIQKIRKESDIPIMVSPGVVNRSVLADLAEAGADWYACYQETYARPLFAKVRPGQNFDTRYGAKLTAREKGMHLEEGMLIGLGESLEDRANTIIGMRELDADQVRVMSLVAHPDTPMADMAPTPEIEELKVIAVMRLVMPDRLIPASLDVGGLAGLKRRLEAGANVVTSMIIPGMGLSGVANQELDIEDARRTPEAIAPILRECGLTPASADEFRPWLAARNHTRTGGRSGL
ncbi:methylornithine synthase PylB [Desulfobulbus rhabdoformis]|uniref:methylornithine synthase PylB n=1 Tax=Desulfobulbus rhabdoformis TaxID=34032 RepID=UPI001964565E|nr:methylornithine synthase PylB [Desulfobulbus rhabdoformis]MBM9615901.1 methylornithine synthase PylB [Desulfobulbus rhabdoformis]